MLKVISKEKTEFCEGKNVEYKLIFNKNRYDIQAIFYDADGNEEYSSYVRDITTIEEYAKNLFEEIVKNKVSPCHLCDIIIDKICS